MPSEETRPKAAWSEAKRLNASEQASRRTAQLNAHGRAILALAALVGQQGGSTGPDVLRRLIGQQDTLTVLDSVGYGAAELAQSWQAGQPSRGPAQRHSSPWTGSPDHHPAVIQALTHGASDAELTRIRRSVAAETAEQAAVKQRQEDVYYGRNVSAAVGVPVDERGVPQQTSTIRRDVPELGSEQ
jgi:hypothetical protein